MSIFTHYPTRSTVLIRIESILYIKSKLLVGYINSYILRRYISSSSWYFLHHLWHTFGIIIYTFKIYEIRLCTKKMNLLLLVHTLWTHRQVEWGRYIINSFIYVLVNVLRVLTYTCDIIGACADVICIYFQRKHNNKSLYLFSTSNKSL